MICGPACILAWIAVGPVVLGLGVCVWGGVGGGAAGNPLLFHTRIRYPMTLALRCLGIVYPLDYPTKTCAQVCTSSALTSTSFQDHSPKRALGTSVAPQQVIALSTCTLHVRFMVLQASHNLNRAHHANEEIYLTSSRYPTSPPGTFELCLHPHGRDTLFRTCHGDFQYSGGRFSGSGPN